MLGYRRSAHLWERRREVAGGPLVVADESEEVTPGAVGEGMGDQIDSGWRNFPKHVSIFLHRSRLRKPPGTRGAPWI